MTIKAWTKEEIMSMLQARDAAVVKGVVAIFERQTRDEQAHDQTHHLNGIGFNGCDAQILSSFAKQIMRWRVSREAGTAAYSSPLSPKQIAIARKKIIKYAGQLTTIANAVN